MDRVATAARHRVLVLDTHQRIGLAACRALGAAGYDVGAADSQDDLGSHSRHTARFHRIPPARDSGAAFSAALEEVVGRHGYEVVVASDDATIARLHHSVPSVPTVPAVGPDSGYEALVDKVALADLCAQAGVRYPATAVPADFPDDAAAVLAVGLPCFVKTARSGQVDGDRVRMRKGAVPARTLDDALTAMAAFRAIGCAPIVQAALSRQRKYVAAVVRAGGHSQVRLVMHAVRDWPPLGGVSTLNVSVSSSVGDGRLACDALERLLDAAGYEGVAGAEFLRTGDAEHDLQVVDVNPRFFGSAMFGERLGLRITERAVRHALGDRPLPDADYEVGRRYHHLAGDVRWIGSPAAERGPIRTLWGTYGLRDVYENVDVRDPGPLVHLVSGRLRRLVRRAPA